MSETETKNVATLDIRGTSVSVTVRIWQGYGKGAVPTATFKAKMAGKEFSADTLEALRNKLLVASKQKAVRIHEPVDRFISGSYRSAPRIERWYITGVHLGTDNPLLESEPREDGGKPFKEQLDRSYRVEFFTPLAPARAAEYVALKVEEGRVHEALSKFEKEYGIDNLERFAKEKVNARLDSEEVAE